MQDFTLGQGMHPSVTWHRGHYVVTWQEWSVIHRREIAGTESSTITLTDSSASYPKVHSHLVWLYQAWRDGSTGWMSIDGGSPSDLGQLHGASPLVFGGEYVAYQTDGAAAGWPIALRHLIDGRIEDAGAGVGVGLSRIVDTDVRTWDDDRYAVPGLHDPCWAGELVVGATDRHGRPCAVVQHIDGRELELWLGEDSQNPQMAHDAGTGTYCVVAWSAGGDGVRAAIFSLADLAVPVEPPVTPEPPIPGLNPPVVTIASYEPPDGPVPLKVRAVATIAADSGPVDTLTWRDRPLGRTAWHEVTNPATDLDHTFTFTVAGEYEISLKAVGPGGTDQTGSQRLITARESELPMPEPEYVTTGFLCHDAVHYLCADAGVDDAQGKCKLVADRTAQGLYETFELIPQPQWEGLAVAIRCKTNGKYLRAAGGGGGNLYADGDSIRDHTTFTLQPVAGVKNGVAIRTWDWWYTRVEGGGGTTADATAREINVWEQYSSTVPLFAAPAAAGIQGQLRIEHGAVRDDTGFVLPLFCHAGDLMAEWTHNPAFVDQFLSKVIAAGFTGIRFWSSLGWHNHPVLGNVELGPRYQPNYYDLLAEWLVKLRDLGLVAHMAPGTLYPADVGNQDDHAARLGQVVRSVGSTVVALFEGANESRDTCPSWEADRLAQFVYMFKRHAPDVLCALSAYTGHEDAKITNAYAIDPAKVAILHQLRLARLADMIQHTFSFRYIGTEYHDSPPVAVKRDVIWNGEGHGPGRLVSAHAGQGWMTDATMAAYGGAALTFHQPYNFFSGPGVKCTSEPIENMPGFKSVAATRDLLPKDVMTWKIYHGGETWAAIRILKPIGNTRAAHALSADGRFCIWVYDGNLQTEQVRGTITSEKRYDNAAILYQGHL